MCPDIAKCPPGGGRGEGREEGSKPPQVGNLGLGVPVLARVAGDFPGTKPSGPFQVLLLPGFSETLDPVDRSGLPASQGALPQCPLQDRAPLLDG